MLQTKQQVQANRLTTKKMLLKRIKENQAKADKARGENSENISQNQTAHTPPSCTTTTPSTSSSTTTTTTTSAVVSNDFSGDTIVNQINTVNTLTAAPTFDQLVEYQIKLVELESNLKKTATERDLACEQRNAAINEALIKTKDLMEVEQVLKLVLSKVENMTKPTTTKVQCSSASPPESEGTYLNIVEVIIF
jgi:hypothetical protein